MQYSYRSGTVLQKLTIKNVSYCSYIVFYITSNKFKINKFVVMYSDIASVAEIGFTTNTKDFSIWWKYFCDSEQMKSDYQLSERRE